MNEAQIEAMLDRIWQLFPETADMTIWTDQIAEKLMDDITNIVYDVWTAQENEVDPEWDEPVRNEGYD